MRRAYVVINPVAGGSEPDAIEGALEVHFRRPAWSYECYRTRGDERLPEVIGSALPRDFDLFVAAGGDGTVSGVAGALVRSDKPLGVLPVGTGNALAQDLGIPQELDRAAALLAGEHAYRAIDAFSVEGRFFILNVSAGLSARMMDETSVQEKRLVGALAYVWSGAEELADLDLHEFEVTVDGQRSRLRAVDVLALNSGVMGFATASWGSENQLDDGLAEVYALQPRRPLDLVQFAWRRLLQRPVQERRVRQWYARQRVAIDSESPLPVQGDGDVFGTTPIEIRLVPHAVRVVVPTGV